MNIRKAALAAGACLCLYGVAIAQTPAGIPAPRGTPGPVGPQGMVEPLNPTPVKSPPPGPFKVTIEAYPALATHTVYRPTDLTPFTGAKKLPIVAWINGGCFNVGRAAAPFLTQIASHGYLTISGGPIDAAMRAMPGTRVQAGDAPVAPVGAVAPVGGAAAAPGGAAAPATGRTADDAMKRAVDWAVAENTRAGSPLAGKINVNEIAVMGTSCGGSAALAMSPDPRVKTTIVWNSGIPVNRPSSNGLTKETLTKLHTPIAYITGGPVDLADANAKDDVSRISHVPVFYGWIDVGHGGTFRQPEGGRYGEVAVAWLDWQLKHDQKAAKMFVGADCTLCKDPVWTAEWKNLK